MPHEQVTVASVRENQRDVGLVPRSRNLAFAASIVSMIVGAGIFAVPAALAACVGPYAPLAFLACGFAVGAAAAPSGTPLNFRFLGAAADISISSMLTLIVLGSRQEIIGLAALIGLSVFPYLIQARIAPVKPH